MLFNPNAIGVGASVNTIPAHADGVAVKHHIHGRWLDSGFGRVEVSEIPNRLATFASEQRFQCVGHDRIGNESDGPVGHQCQEAAVASVL